MVQDIPQIANLFDKAKTDEWTVVEYVAGAERIATKAKLSDCIGNGSHNSRIYYVFQKTIGVYKYRIFQTINPLYWLDMPTRWMQSLDTPPKPFVQKLLSMLLWLIGVVISYLIGKFLDLSLSGDFLTMLESMIR